MVLIKPLTPPVRQRRAANVEIVATLKRRDDAALSKLISECDARRHPGEVGFDQLICEVRAMRVKPNRNQNRQAGVSIAGHHEFAIARRNISPDVPASRGVLTIFGASKS